MLYANPKTLHANDISNNFKVMLVAQYRISADIKFTFQCMPLDLEINEYLSAN